MRQDAPCDYNKISRELPRHQRTLVVNESAREVFSKSLFDALDQPQTCRMWVRSVVFDPHAINALCRKYSLTVDEDGTYLNDAEVVAESSVEVLELFVASHDDWVDAFLYSQSSDVWVYKDHDEYTTLYSKSEERLAIIVSRMVLEGHEEVVGWIREPLR